MEALQRGLARVAGRGGEDDDALGNAELFARLGDKLGQHGERHVLESTRRAAEKLKHPRIARAHERRKALVFKPAAVRALHKRAHILKVWQQVRQQQFRHAELIQREAAPPVKGARGDIRVNIQPPVRCDAAYHGLKGVCGVAASGALIVHDGSLSSKR